MLLLNDSCAGLRVRGTFLWVDLGTSDTPSSIPAKVSIHPLLHCAWRLSITYSSNGRPEESKCIPLCDHWNIYIYHHLVKYNLLYGM